MPRFRIRPVRDTDRAWVARLLEQHWHSPEIVTRGRVHQADRLPGFLAEIDGQPVGLATDHSAGDQCEVVSLNRLHDGVGLGTALLDTVREAARLAGCRRMWLITTNDNLAALRFYQKRGWRLGECPSVSTSYPGWAGSSKSRRPVQRPSRRRGHGWALRCRRSQSETTD